MISNDGYVSLVNESENTRYDDAMSFIVFLRCFDAGVGVSGKKGFIVMNS